MMNLGAGSSSGHSRGPLPLDKKTGTPKLIFGYSAPPCVILVYPVFLTIPRSPPHLCCMTARERYFAPFRPASSNLARMACLHFLDSYSVSGFRFFTLVAAQPAPRRLARKTTGRLSMTDAPPSGEAKPGCQRGPVCLCNADACPAPLCDGFVSAPGAAECYPEADRWVAISSIWKDFRCPSLEPVREHCHRLPREEKEKRLSSTHLLRPAGGLSNSPTPPAASPCFPNHQH